MRNSIITLKPNSLQYNKEVCKLSRCMFKTKYKRNIDTIQYEVWCW